MVPKMSNSFQLHGIDETLNSFTRLKKVTQKNTVRRCLRRAANVVRDAARVNAKAIDDPDTREKIWKNTTTQSGKSTDPNVLIMRVGIRGGAAVNQHSKDADMSRLSGGDTRHWRFIEFGSANNRALPFMRTALSQNIHKATDVFCDEFKKEVLKELAK